MRAAILLADSGLTSSLMRGKRKGREQVINQKVGTISLIRSALKQRLALLAKNHSADDGAVQFLAENLSRFVPTFAQ